MGELGAARRGGGALAMEDVELGRGPRMARPQGSPALPRELARSASAGGPPRARGGRTLRRRRRSDDRRLLHLRRCGRGTRTGPGGARWGLGVEGGDSGWGRKEEEEADMWGP